MHKSGGAVPNHVVLTARMACRDVNEISRDPAHLTPREGLPMPTNNDVHRQLRRRRAAARRLPPLPCSHWDPFDHDGQEPVTAKVLNAWRAARAHLRAAGYEPILPPIIRELVDEVPPGEDAA